MKYLRYIILIASLISIPVILAYGQDEEEAEPAGPTTTMKISMVKQGGFGHFFTITLVAEYEDHADFIENGEIIVGLEGAEGEKELGKTSTDGEGYAEILIPSSKKLEKDDEGYYNFTVNYAGDDVYEGASESIRVKDFIIKLDAHQIDTVKMLYVDAYSIEADGSQIPFTDGEIGIYIQGMFSRLPLEPIWMENGHGEIEFPNDIIGDPLGKVKIYAAVLEHDEYGNVEDGLMRIWGLGYRHANIIGRELWTSEAPWWMVITLLIMITGVWGHYIFAMTQLARVGRIGKEEKSEDKG